MIKSIIPIFSVSDINEAIDFYTSKLDFDLGFQYHLDGDETNPIIFAAVRKDKCSLYLQMLETSEKSRAYIICEDLAPFYDQMLTRKVKITYGPVEQPYGIKELHIEDPFGNSLSFGKFI